MATLVPLIKVKKEDILRRRKLPTHQHHHHRQPLSIRPIRLCKRGGTRCQKPLPVLQHQSKRPIGLCQQQLCRRLRPRQLLQCVRHIRLRPRGCFVPLRRHLQLRRSSGWTTLLRWPILFLATLGQSHSINSKERKLVSQSIKTDLMSGV